MTISLIHGDALSILPTFEPGSFDAVITDPPYASGGVFALDRVRPPSDKYQGSRTKASYPSFGSECRDQYSHWLWSYHWLSAALAVTRPGGWLMAFADWRQLPLMSNAIQSAGWIWRGVLVWDKTEACRPQLGTFRSQAEYVILATIGRRDVSKKVCPAGVYRCRAPYKERRHMTEKPVELMHHMMTVLPDGCHILDPFCGSGTTLAAAHDLGHRATGIELSPDYYEIAAKRLVRG